MIRIITTRRLRALKNSLAIATKHINAQDKTLLEREQMIYRLRESIEKLKCELKSKSLDSANSDKRV